MIKKLSKEPRVNIEIDIIDKINEIIEYLIPDSKTEEAKVKESRPNLGYLMGDTNPNFKRHYNDGVYWYESDEPKYRTITIINGEGFLPGHDCALRICDEDGDTKVDHKNIGSLIVGLKPES